MTDYYNFTNGSLTDMIINAPNVHTGSWFWTAVIYLIWVVALGFLSLFSWEVALISASFFAIVIGAPLLFAGAIAWWAYAVFPCIILFYIIYIMWGKQY